MSPGVFITGTDTDVGKTVAAVALLRGLAANGVRAVGMKPVSAGIDRASGLNADVLALDGASNVRAPLHDRNPYALREAAAPNLVAGLCGVEIDLCVIRDAYARLSQIADAVVVEGAGGAMVPLDDRRDVLDIAAILGVPVVLVVGIRLGCLNHARLSVLAIRARGLRLAGWVASRIDPQMRYADENVAWLARELPAPCIGDFASASPPPMSADRLATLGLPAARC